MASNPPGLGQCCRRGVTHEGVPKGEIKQFAGVDTYFAYPPSGSTEKVILLFTDILGLFINSKLMADDFAAHGYLVIMPDILDKDSAPIESSGPEEFNLGEWLGFNLAAWLAKDSHQLEFVQGVVDSTLAQVKRDFDPKKIGAVGYCFGGRYVIRLLDGRIDAGYTGHPSLTTIEEVAAVKGPLAISAAGIDVIFTPEQRRETEEKLAELGATYQIKVFGGVEHGFSVRGDMKDPKQKFAKEQAFNQAITWFKEYLN